MMDATEQSRQEHEAQFAQLERYLRAHIDASEQRRQQAWKRDFSSLEAYQRSVAPNRERFIAMLGGFPEPAQPTFREEPIGALGSHQASRVWVSLVDGVEAYGVVLRPAGAGPFPAVIAQHGLSGSPEWVCGLIEPPDCHRHFAKTLADHGFLVFAPLVINNTPNRVWLDRLATIVGRRLVGLEILKIKRVVDYLQNRPDVAPGRIGIYGLSQGGLTTLCAGAAEPRLAACVCSAYFNHRTNKLVNASEHYTPYIATDENDKFLFNQLNEFSDSDIAALICPRPFFVEAGNRDPAIWFRDAQAEFAKVCALYERLGIPERAEMEVFEGDHRINAEGSIGFLKRWLA
jgi:dienelactone hydrolase